MIETLLRPLELATWWAPIGAFLWGIGSVLLSPCHLSSVPLLVGFLGRIRGQTISLWRLAAWVTVGMSASLVVLAGISLAAGRILGDLWGIGPWMTIGLLILGGLYLLGAFELPSLGQLRPERARAGAGGALTAGGVLGLTLGPCTFAFFSPLLAFGVGSAPMTLKVATLAAFIGAHLGMTWLAGILGARVAEWIARGGPLAGPIKIVVGIAAIAMAAQLIITLP